MHPQATSPVIQDLQRGQYTTAVGRFVPLTKEDVADLFRVTTRTIENWIEQEGLPLPVPIGNRVYWHPDVFFEWLEQRLLMTKAKPVDGLPLVTTGKHIPAVKAERGQLRERSRARLAAIEGRS